jgi:thiol-disulfide isomerase/thioredoxin
MDNEKHKLRTIVISIILGLIFLVSGITKAADINGFANVLVRYGYSKLYILAPIITFIEIVIAFSFLFLWRVRQIALFSFYFLMFLTAIFLFGYIFGNIDDCGCLGDFYILPVWVSFLRNIFMILTSYWLCKYASSMKLKRFEVVKPIVALSLGLVALFINEVEIIRSYYELTYVSGVSIQNTFLEKYQEKANIEKSIFIFSPGCTDCQNTTKSINKVLKENTNIKLIGLYPNDVSERILNKYKIDLKPNFEIFPISRDSLRKVTHRYPLFIKLKNGKIEKVMKDV